jgi:hypothetical protein
MQSRLVNWLLLFAATAAIQTALSQPVSIISQPMDQTVEVGRQATFSVQASGASLQYQWYTNNVRHLGAVGSSYIIPVTTLTMNGRTCHVVVSNSINAVTSAPARLTVVPDQTAPRVDDVYITDSQRIIVQFNESLLQRSLTNLANYSLFILGTTNRIPITNVAYGVTLLRVAANQVLSPTNGYVLCIANVADVKTNFISPNPTCVGVAFPTTNTLTSFGEIWRYNENETNGLPPSWVTLNYNDDPELPPYHWAEGYGAFAYSFNPTPCSPLRTWLSPGRQTYYFRKQFSAAQSFPAEAVVRLWYGVDDGAVFYLNGSEIYRTGMPPGPVEYSTVATNLSNPVCVSVDLPVGHLFALGPNILAVEVHQGLDSPGQPVDVAFDAELRAVFRRTPVIPVLQVTYGPSTAVLRWEGMGWSLETAASFVGPWSRATTSTNEYVWPLGLTGERRFFRLVNP